LRKLQDLKSNRIWRNLSEIFEISWNLFKGLRIAHR
jgi:hypothetical protein